MVWCGSCEASEEKKRVSWWGVLFTRSTEKACDAKERVHSLCMCIYVE